MRAVSGFAVHNAARTRPSPRARVHAHGSTSLGPRVTASGARRSALGTAVAQVSHSHMTRTPWMKPMRRVSDLDLGECLYWDRRLCVLAVTIEPSVIQTIVHLIALRQVCTPPLSTG